jgi:hypothetical protein
MPPSDERIAVCILKLIEKCVYRSNELGFFFKAMFLFISLDLKQVSRPNFVVSLNVLDEEVKT